MAKESFTDLLPEGTLRSSEIRREATKAHPVCPNWKQQAVSGQGLHQRTNQ